MAKYKEGNSRICVELWDLSTSKDRTPEQGIYSYCRFQNGNGRIFLWIFVTGLPRGKKGNDVVWVVVDRLTKSIFVFAYEND